MDDTRIELHDDVMIGPNLTLCAGTHLFSPRLRRKKAQYNLPIIIEKNFWLGAGTILLPDVIIGENTVIATGSLVTRDIPKNVLAYGFPCKVIRPLE